jgi:uncharacterized membrane protein
VKQLTPLLRLILLAIAVICVGEPVLAAPRIEVSFEPGAADSQKLVRARAVFPTEQSILYDVFNSITAYPMLHHWIEETTLISADKSKQEFLVKFAFPWPVGQQWSRVEVRRTAKAIFWKQLEGSLRANHGRISFTTADAKVFIDYRAAIDIGLPELWTQSYKEKFIREFLTAAYERAEAAATPAALALAAEP